MTQAVRIRTRAVPVDEDLPQVVLDYLQEHHGGLYPDTYPGKLAFVQRCFSDRASKYQRHTIVFRLRLQGMTIPEMARMFGKSERTIERWRYECTQWVSEQYTGQEVREIHTDRMADLAAMQAELNKIAYADKMHGPRGQAP